MNFDKFRDTALLNHLPWTVVKGVRVPTLDIFVFLTAAGFLETESESSSLLLITAAAFARFPFLAGSLAGGASAALALVGFFVASFACKVRDIAEWITIRRVNENNRAANNKFCIS